MKYCDLRKKTMQKTSLESSKENYFRLRIQADAAGMRLDRYLTTILTEISRTKIQQYIENGEILINGYTSKSGYILRIGDEVQVKLLSMQDKALSIIPWSLP